MHAKGQYTFIYENIKPCLYDRIIKRKENLITCKFVYVMQLWGDKPIPEWLDIFLLLSSISFKP